jgi:hypothetical protein
MVSAQQQQRQKTQPTLRDAVASCIVIVWNETDKRAGFKLSQFDAYIRPDGTVMYFSTPKENFSFGKCLNEKGYPPSGENVR